MLFNILVVFLQFSKYIHKIGPFEISTNFRQGLFKPLSHFFNLLFIRIRLRNIKQQRFITYPAYTGFIKVV